MPSPPRSVAAAPITKPTAALMVQDITLLYFYKLNVGNQNYTGIFTHCILGSRALLVPLHTVYWVPGLSWYLCTLSAFAILISLHTCISIPV